MATPSYPAELATDFQAVFALLPGAYLLLSPQLQVELVSAGYREAETAGWPCLPVGTYAPAVLEAAPAGHCLAAKLRASLAQVLQSGQAHAVACRRHCQLPGQVPAGAPLAGWQLVTQPVHDAAGIVSHLLCHIRLDPAVPAPGAPLAPAPLSETDLAAVLAQLPVALCLLRGPRYVVEVFNPLAARVWGVPAGQALGRPFLELLPATTAAAYATACAEVGQSGQPVVWPETLAAATYATGPAYFDLHFQLLPPEREEPGRLLLTAREVTPLLQARQQVQQLQADLAATTAGLADYVAELLLKAPGEESNT